MQNSQALLERIKGYRPISGVGQLEDFLQGNIYLDFQNELMARIENLRDELEISDSKNYIELKGAVKALREQAATIFIDLLENRKSDILEEDIDNG